jgi:hypothetical protein
VKASADANDFFSVLLQTIATPASGGCAGSKQRHGHQRRSNKQQHPPTGAAYVAHRDAKRWMTVWWVQVFGSRWQHRTGWRLRQAPGMEYDNSAGAGAVYGAAAAPGVRQGLYKKHQHTQADDSFVGWLRRPRTLPTAGAYLEDSFATGVEQLNEQQPFSGWRGLCIHPQRQHLEITSVRGVQHETNDNFGYSLSADEQTGDWCVGRNQQHIGHPGGTPPQTDDGTRAGAVLCVHPQCQHLEPAGLCKRPTQAQMTTGWAVALSADSNTLATAK